LHLLDQPKLQLLEAVLNLEPEPLREHPTAAATKMIVSLTMKAEVLVRGACLFSRLFGKVD